MQFQIAKQHSGFTLVETLVAIAILLLVIIGPMTVAQKGIQSAYYANEQLTATFLAQEAIETVRQLRDDRALAAWNAPGTLNTATWGTDCTSGCSLSGTTLIQNPAGDTLVEDGVTFTRKIFLGPTSDIRSLTVTVDWTNQKLFGGNVRTVKLQTYLYNYYKRYGT